MRTTALILFAFLSVVLGIALITFCLLVMLDKLYWVLS